MSYPVSSCCLFCCVLSCAVLCCLVMFFVVFFPVLCPVLSCPVLSYPVLSRRVPPCPALPCPVLCCRCLCLATQRHPTRQHTYTHTNRCGCHRGDADYEVPDEYLWSWKNATSTGVDATSTGVVSVMENSSNVYNIHIRNVQTIRKTGDLLKCGRAGP